MCVASNCIVTSKFYCIASSSKKKFEHKKSTAMNLGKVNCYTATHILHGIFYMLHAYAWMSFFRAHQVGKYFIKKNGMPHINEHRGWRVSFFSISNLLTQDQVSVIQPTCELNRDYSQFLRLYRCSYILHENATDVSVLVQYL